MARGRPGTRYRGNPVEAHMIQRVDVVLLLSRCPWLTFLQACHLSTRTTCRAARQGERAAPHMGMAAKSL